MNRFLTRFVAAWCVGIVALFATSLVQAQAVLGDPVETAQLTAARTTLRGVAAGAYDPIDAAYVEMMTRTVFPKLAGNDPVHSILAKALANPSMRGNLLGRLAEQDWLNRNSDWRPTRRRNAPQNDAWRYVDGKMEGAQIKVHKNWHNYIRSMRSDNKAEKFVLPDDHYDLVKEELRVRRLGALRGGLSEKAAEYEGMERRLTKLGRTYANLDSSLTRAPRVFKALAQGGKAVAFVAIACGILDGAIAVYEVATGQSQVEELALRLGKAGLGTAASWGVTTLAVKAAVAAGATGAVPVAVAIVVGTTTYLVVDWACDSVADSLRVAPITVHDLKRVWPEGARGIPLDGLYRKPEDKTAPATRSQSMRSDESRLHCHRGRWLSYQVAGPVSRGLVVTQPHRGEHASATSAVCALVKDQPGAVDRRRPRWIIMLSVERLLCAGGRQQSLLRSSAQSNSSTRSFLRRIFCDFGVSHRASGTARCGKFNMALHSDLQFGGVVLGNSQTNQGTEPHNNEGKQMNETNQCKNDVVNMSSKTYHGKSIALWGVLLLVAPLV